MVRIIVGTVVLAVAILAQNYDINSDDVPRAYLAITIVWLCGA